MQLLPVRMCVMFIAPCNGQCGYGFRGRVPEHRQRARKCRCRRRIAVWGVSQEPAAINVLLRHPGVLGQGLQPQGGQGAWYISQWGC